MSTADHRFRHHHLIIFLIQSRMLVKGFSKQLVYLEKHLKKELKQKSKYTTAKEKKKPLF